MFTWLNKQGVKSDRGFEVQFIDRFTVEYREGGKTITINFEDGYNAGKPCLIIEEDAFKTWDLGLSLTKEKRAEIIRDFTEAIEFQGLAVVI